MADHRGAEPRDPRVPAELFRSTALPTSVDLAAALDGLDRATRNFNRHLGEGGLAAELPRFPAREGGGTGPEAPRARTAPEATASPARAASSASREALFERQMRDAEREAREYLASAKRRADSLVSAMVEAVEREAEEIRAGAEEGIRARWQQVEVDASRHVENARRVAAHMVAERQERIAALSEGISGRAVALTAGMDDAARVRAQFDSFVRALSVTADQIAKASASGGTPGELRKLRVTSRPSSIAA